MPSGCLPQTTPHLPGQLALPGDVYQLRNQSERAIASRRQFCHPHSSPGLQSSMVERLISNWPNLPRLQKSLSRFWVIPNFHKVVVIIVISLCHVCITFQALKFSSTYSLFYSSTPPEVATAADLQELWVDHKNQNGCVRVSVNGKNLGKEKSPCSINS